MPQLHSWPQLPGSLGRETAQAEASRDPTYRLQGYLLTNNLLVGTGIHRKQRPSKKRLDCDFILKNEFRIKKIANIHLMLNIIYLHRQNCMLSAGLSFLQTHEQQIK